MRNDGLFRDDIDADLYALIRTTSLDKVSAYVIARDDLRELIADRVLEGATSTDTVSDTIPVSYVAATSRPAEAA